MYIVEIVAVVFSALCVWFAVKKHLLNWPSGLIAVSAYGILFFREKLYADMLLQGVFFVQGIIGWIQWNRKRVENDHYVPGWLTSHQRLLMIGSILFSASVVAFLLHRFTDASTPIPDAFGAVISLAANFLLIRAKTENWILWIIANCLYVLLFCYKELYLSSGIYVIFLALSVKGWIDWKQKNDLQKDLY